MPRYAMVIDLQRCVGCSSCSISCRNENNVPEGIYWSHKITETSGTFPNVRFHYIPTLCNHCDNAPCARGCPTRAMHKLENGMSIEVDEAGIIMEVSSEEEEVSEEAPVAEEDVVEVAGEEIAEEETKVDVAMEEVIEEKIEEKMKMIFEVVEEVAKDVASIKEEMGAMKTKMEKFAKAPAAAAAPKMTVSNEKFEALDSKLDFIKSLKK